MDQLDVWEHSEYGTIEDFQRGYIYYNSKLPTVTGDYTIGQGDAPASDGTFELNAGPDITLSTGSKVKIVGLCLGGDLIDYEDGSYSFGYAYIPFPMSFEPIEINSASLKAAKTNFIRGAKRNVDVISRKADFSYGPVLPEKSIRK